MKKLLLTGLLILNTSVMAQMTDMMGTMAIQGLLTNQGTQSATQGLTAARNLQILQDIQQTAMEIQSTHYIDYTGVNKSSVFGHPFTGLDWTVGSDQSGSFYIQLNRLNQSTCQYLTGQGTGAKTIYINGNRNQICESVNNMKFVF